MIIRRLKEMWPWRPVCETSTSAGGWGFDFGLFNRLHFMVNTFLPPLFDHAIEIRLRLGPFMFTVEAARGEIVKASWKVDAMLTKQNEHRRRYPLFLIGEI